MKRGTAAADDAGFYGYFLTFIQCFRYKYRRSTSVVGKHQTSTVLFRLQYYVNSQVSPVPPIVVPWVVLARGDRPTSVFLLEAIARSVIQQRLHIVSPAVLCKEM